MTNNLNDTDIKQALENISIKSPEHLKKWLIASGRRWLVFDGVDLINSLDYPAGVLSLMQIINSYQAYRSSKMSNRIEKIEHPLTHEIIETALPKCDVLELEELDRCVRYLIGLASTKDINWNINNSPL